MRYLILSSGRIIKHMEHIDIQTFWKLKPGDRVVTYIGAATVLIGPTIGNNIVQLIHDKKDDPNALFYNYEIKSVIK